ncbi:MAG: SLATT domain-containing protein [Sphaerochaetaceae bacterium]
MAANSQHNEALKTQIREAYGRIVYTYTTHLKKMNRLDKNNRCIKYTQIGLSAISTGGFLGSIITNQVVMTFIGGIFSTVLLFTNLYFKDFNLAEESKQHRIAADNLWLIREQYISLLTDFDAFSENDIIAKRDDLQKLTFEIYNKSPKTDVKSYKAAQRALKFEEEQFFAPEEIDKILPVHLRISK